MNVYLNYLIEANLGIILFLLLYWFVFRKETDFTFNRLYWISSIIISLTSPFIHAGGNDSIPSVSQVLPSYFLPEITIGDTTKQAFTISNSITPWLMIFSIYLMVASILSIRLLYRCVKILIFFKNTPFILVDGKYKLHQSAATIPTFSFFQFIVIGNCQSLTVHEKEQIIRHEIVHAQKLHSIDILLIELTSILFWFNPATRIIKNIISDIHEFQADEKVVNNRDVQAYCSLLAKRSLQSAGFSLANHFTKSLTIKRIAMIKSIKKKISPWKIAFLAPVAASFAFLVACQDQVISEIHEISESSTMVVDMPLKVKAQFDDLQKVYPKNKILVTEITNEDGMKKAEELFKKYGGPDNTNIANMNIIKLNKEDGKDAGRNFIIINVKNPSSPLAEMTKDGEVFHVVEESALPKNGADGFVKFVQAEMKYPLKAKESHIAGKVFIEFIVETDGSLTNINVLKGIGHGCDDEAIRVLSLTSPWNPGKQNGQPVRQKMTLPIFFQEGSNNSVTAKEIKPLEQSIVVTLDAIKSDNEKVNLQGHVTDEAGNPLNGAHVIVKGTTRGVPTDSHGYFTITVDHEESLVFSHIGFETKEVKY